jgi:hypothetical protein
MAAHMGDFTYYVIAVRTDSESEDTELLLGSNEGAPEWINTSELQGVFYLKD